MSPDIGKTSIATSSASWRDVPATVWTLGFVSLLMDVSSELIHSLLPVFLTTVVGASTVYVGLIEGVAEATAAIAKVFRARSPTASASASCWSASVMVSPAVTKPVFPLAGTAWEVLAARFIDRIGKGIRDAPRDALIADITPSAVRGAGYGIRQALDTVGGVCGPAVGGRADGALCQRFSRGVLVGAAARRSRGAADRDRRSRAGRHTSDRRSAAGRFASKTSNGCLRRSGSSLRSAWCSRSRDSARRFWC